MEVSSHALVQKRVGCCQFASATLTNISQDHLDFHVTMDAYWKSKRMLFEELNNSVHSNKSAVVNLDDALAAEFLKPVGNAVRKLTYGWDPAADLSVINAEFDFSGTRLSLRTPQGELSFKLLLSGRFNVYNVMAAMLICHAEGLSLEQCAKSLEEFPGVSGRFEVVSIGSADEPLCIVDYAHTPDGLENVVKTARNLVPPGGKLICVFGCGGDRDPSKRPQMGEIAETHADEVVVTSDNPRTEEPQHIIANILAGIRRMNRIKVEPDRSTAIRMTIREAGSKDVVVIAGKGHENYQILADKIIPFDDRTEVRLALEERARMLAQRG
jgi:UDP-N-acetylmuramoyl-L-alanyl-D-glutamate--2,6-diaminopimelate ligase